MHASQIFGTTTLVALFAALASGCFTHPSETPYRDAVMNVGRMLESKVDAGIMPFTTDVGDTETAFRFIEGDQREKVDHATPLRITVQIISKEDGKASAFEVEAYKHGVKFRTRDAAAEERWATMLARAIQWK